MFVETAIAVPVAVLDYAEELISEAIRHIDEAEKWVARAAIGSARHALIADAMLARADRTLRDAYVALGIEEPSGYPDNDASSGYADIRGRKRTISTRHPNL